jgi:hypothetical protein
MKWPSNCWCRTGAGRFSSRTKSTSWVPPRVCSCCFCCCFRRWCWPAWAWGQSASLDYLLVVDAGTCWEFKPIWLPVDAESALGGGSRRSGCQISENLVRAIASNRNHGITR